MNLSEKELNHIPYNQDFNFKDFQTEVFIFVERLILIHQSKHKFNL
jgi:hypothetical protein